MVFHPEEEKVFMKRFFTQTYLEVWKLEWTPQGSGHSTCSRNIWTTLSGKWCDYLSCPVQAQELDFNGACVFIPTQDILWFHDFVQL